MSIEDIRKQRDADWTVWLHENVDWELPSHVVRKMEEAFRAGWFYAFQRGVESTQKPCEPEPSQSQGDCR